MIQSAYTHPHEYMQTYTLRGVGERERASTEHLRILISKRLFQLLIKIQEVNKDLETWPGG